MDTPKRTILHVDDSPDSLALTRRWLEPEHATKVPEGLEVCDIRDEILTS